MPGDASIDMVRAAEAMLDPKLGNSGARIAWDAMLSPEARRAVFTRACIELGATVLGQFGERFVHRVSTVQQPAFIEATEYLAKARVALGRVKDPGAVESLNIAIKQANDIIANTYRPERVVAAGLELSWRFSEEEAREKSRSDQ